MAPKHPGYVWVVCFSSNGKESNDAWKADLQEATRPKALSRFWLWQPRPAPDCALPPKTVNLNPLLKHSCRPALFHNRGKCAALNSMHTTERTDSNRLSATPTAAENGEKANLWLSSLPQSPASPPLPRMHSQ